jgi:hypothetical protein
MTVYELVHLGPAKISPVGRNDSLHWFPRASVGTQSGRASVQWTGHMRRYRVPTPARLHQKKEARIELICSQVTMESSYKNPNLLSMAR